jgi:hypothetical protein
MPAADAAVAAGFVRGFAFLAFGLGAAVDFGAALVAMISAPL